MLQVTQANCNNASRLSTLEASYSSASFESMDRDSVCTTDSSSGDEDIVGRTVAYSSKGMRRTIQGKQSL